MSDIRRRVISLTQAPVVVARVATGLAGGWVLGSSSSFFVRMLSSAAGPSRAAPDAESTLAAAVLGGVVGLMIGVAVTGRQRLHDDDGPGLPVTYAVLAAFVAVIGALALLVTSGGRLERRQHEQLTTAVRSGGFAALRDAEDLVWRNHDGRVGGAVADILRDPSVKDEGRLAAGLILVRAGAATPEETAIVASMMRPARPLRLTAIQALDREGYCRPEGRLGALLTSLRDDPDPHVRVAVACALDWHDPATRQWCGSLPPLLQHPERRLRRGALRAASVCDQTIVRQMADAALKDGDPEVRADAQRYLATIGATR